MESVDALSNTTAQHLLDLGEKYNALSDKVLEIQLRIKTSIDLTDDLMSTASNAIDASNNTLTYTDSLLTSTTIIVAIAAIGLTIGIQLWSAKDKKKQINDAIENVVEDITKDRNLLNELITKITESDEGFGDLSIFTIE